MYYNERILLMTEEQIKALIKSKSYEVLAIFMCMNLDESAQKRIFDHMSEKSRIILQHEMEKFQGKMEEGKTIINY